MDKKRARELLKQALNEIPHLRRLPPQHPDFESWRKKVCGILESASSRNSWEYRKFTDFTGLSRPSSDEERQEAYNSYLDYKETALQEIINKYEIWYKKLWEQSKDFIATVIAKFLAEKTK